VAGAEEVDAEVPADPGEEGEGEEGAEPLEAESALAESALGASDGFFALL
jgi:hypothetical protein